MTFESRLSKKGSVGDDGCLLVGINEVCPLRVGYQRRVVLVMMSVYW